MVRGGQMTFTGRKHPSLTGMSGPVTALKMVRMDESSPVRVALIGPGTWGCVPEVADELVVGDRDGHPHGERPVTDPVIVDHVAGFEHALRQPAQLPPRQPLAVVQQM